MKQCIVCKIEKDFIANNSKCKECNKEYDRKYYLKNKNIILNKKKIYYKCKEKEILKKRIDYYKENKENKQIYNKQYYEDNKEKIIEQEKDYRSKNVDKIRLAQNEYSKNRRKIDFGFRLKTNISANVGAYFKSNNLNKDGKSSIKNLSYSIKELKNYLESKFEPWMNWSNYGSYRLKTWNDNDQSTWTWQLDHIIPHSTFKYKSVEDLEFKKCWALENLRPYSSKQNFLDGMSRVRHVNTACERVSVVDV